MCLKSLQTYIKYSESALCIRFFQLIWYVVDSEATFHCVASLSLDNPLRANGNLHVCFSFKINYSRDTLCWEHLPGWRKYTAMKSGDWKVKRINTSRWTSFFHTHTKGTTSLFHFSSYWLSLWIVFYFWGINDTNHFINIYIYIFNWHLAKGLKLKETDCEMLLGQLWHSAGSLMVAPSGYEQCSGAGVTQMLLNVLCMTSQLA